MGQGRRRWLAGSRAGSIVIHLVSRDRYDRAAAKQPPVTRLIIKYRDGAISEAAARTEALRPAAIARLSSLAGQPVTHERAMSGGAYVVRLFRALPLDQVRSLARYLASDGSAEAADARA